MSLEMTLKRVAVMQHKHRAVKINRRAKRQESTGLEKAAFEQSKIPEMWETVAHIEIPNPAPEEIAGTMVQLKDLKIPWSQVNHTGAGLELYDRNDAIALWSVGVESHKTKTGGALLTYRASGYKFGFCEQYNTAENGPNNAEIQFVETFLKWLARRIPQTTLIDLGIDFDEIETIEKELDDALTAAQKPKRKISRV